MKKKTSGRVAAGLAVLVLSATVDAYAGSIIVASNGADSGTCGASDDPCATIAQAVTNAALGDTIAVGPGVYAGTSIVDKAVTLVSSAGTGAAIINSTMNLNFQGIVLGKKGKGFSFNVAGTAVSVNGDEIVVRGNRFSDGTIGVEVNVSTDVVVRDNSFDAVGTGISNVSGELTVIRGNVFGYSQTTAIALGTLSTGAIVRENRAHGPSGSGISIAGANHFLFRNHLHGCPAGGYTSSAGATDVVLQENIIISASSPGFWLQAGSGWILEGNAAVNNNAPGFLLTAGTPFTVIDNVAVGNASNGIGIAGGNDHVLIGNTAIQNGSAGILLGSVGTGVTVTGGNLYGNGMNCGLENSSGSAVTSNDVYWGAPTGPGADPADAVCGNIPVTLIESYADSPDNVKMPSIK